MLINDYNQSKKLLIPALVFILLIWAIPFLYQIILSFLDYRIANPDTKGDFIGIENYYHAIFEDKGFRGSILRTSIFIFFTLLIQIILGIFLAISLVSLKKKSKQIVLIILIIPMVLAPFVVGLAWNYQFNPVFGPATYFSKSLGLLNEESSFLDANNAFFSICSVDIWQNTSFMTLIFASAINGVPKSVTESLKIHRIGKYKRVFKVYFKYIIPIAIIAIFLRLIGLIKTFDTIHILTQGGPSNITETFSLYSHRISFKELNFGLGSAEGLIINYSILFLVLFFLKRINFYKA